jgi:hypothetical protein
LQLFKPLIKKFLGQHLKNRIPYKKSVFATSKNMATHAPQSISMKNDFRPTIHPKKEVIPKEN